MHVATVGHNPDFARGLTAYDIDIPRLELSAEGIGALISITSAG